MLRTVMPKIKSRRTWNNHARPSGNSLAAGVQAGIQTGAQAALSDKEIAILQVCIGGAVAGAILLRALGYSGQTKNFRTWLDRPLKEDLLEMIIPDKPTSPSQKYRLTDKGPATVENLGTEGT